MNCSEEFIVIGSRFYLRYNLAHTMYAHDLRRGKEGVHLMHKACYQLTGGRSTLHDFALNLETLKKLLELYA